MIRNNVCINAHPLGCGLYVKKAADFVRDKERFDGPKNVLVIGCSTGYGLATRIAAHVGAGAKTIGVAFEREPTEKRTGSAGWYADTYYREVVEPGAVTFNVDAFSHESKQTLIQEIKRSVDTVDLVVYSLASGIRIDPDTGLRYTSVLKPIGKTYESQGIDVQGNLVSVHVNPATEEEIANTVKVMGGEDWELWINALLGAGVLSPNAITLAYSYIGPTITQDLYRSGTIGRAKEDLEARAKKIDAQMQNVGGHAYISVNKALVTRASSVIPSVPLYLALLYKLMKERGTHEDCIAQMDRMLREKIYGAGEIPLDADGRIRLDDYEMQEDIQNQVGELWKQVGNVDLSSIGDTAGVYTEFLNIHGFGYPSIDYSKDVDLRAVR